MQKKSLISSLILFFLFGLIACQKKSTAPTTNPITPLQTLVNSDTTLTLFHRMILRANETGLLADNPVSLLIPTNAILRSAGYSETIIDSTPANFLDRLVRYQYVTAALSPDSGLYTAYPTLLGSPVYISNNAGGRFLINGSATIPDTALKVGKADVYFLDAVLPAATDSLPQLLQSDTSLSFLSEIFLRTNFYDSVLVAAGGQYTLLAPVNDAFRRAGYDSVTDMDSVGIDTLIQLAQNQVLKGLYFTNTFPLQTPLPLLSGSSVTVSSTGGQLVFTTSGAPVNWLAGNQVAGAVLVLHKTDGILSP